MGGDLKEDIAALFPSLARQSTARMEFMAGGAPPPKSRKKLKFGVVLSGGQAPGGHNVIAGLAAATAGHTLVGFRGGPGGVMRNERINATPSLISKYLNLGGCVGMHTFCSP